MGNLKMDNVSEWAPKLRPLSERPQVPVDIPGAVIRQWNEGRVVPSSDVMEWPWYSEFFPRPSTQTYTFSVPSLADAQAAWDRSADFVKTQRRLESERAERVTAKEAALQKVRDAEREEQLAEFTATLKRRYLAVPGRTEEQFEQALPELLEAHARQLALASDGPAFAGIKLFG